MKVIQIKDVTEKLDSVSPSMCLAKWTQTTIYLNSGSTHSCHHPGVHQIPIEGLADNPGMIHNTPFKMLKRQEMLDGKRPSECDYCWRIEDLDGNHVSDRTYKSMSPWSYPHFDKVIQSQQGPNFAPTYLEVLFDSTCNFACTYCLPEVSSKIFADYEAHGPYMISSGPLHYVGTDRATTKITLQKADTNPYIEAFWKIIPEWWSNLHTFRITGGEPLLSKHTWSMFEHVEKNANKNLTFAVNSNLGVPDVLIDKFINQINLIQPNLAAFEVYTSVEAVGKQAEYIRFGMDYEKFMSNVEKVLAQTKARVICMTTINALSYSTFKDFIETWKVLRTKYPHRVLLSLNYLRHPNCMDAQNLPREIKDEWAKDLDCILTDVESFHEFEINQLKRFYEYMMVQSPTEKLNQIDLAMYVRQLDERRKLNFTETFPILHKLLLEVSRDAQKDV